MLWKYKKVYQETTEDVTIPCNNRYLTNVFATPNSQLGGCNMISIRFHFAGWQPGDDIEMYSWTMTNADEVYTINSCIDLNTLTYNCLNRITFTWDDNTSCCV